MKVRMRRRVGVRNALSWATYFAFDLQINSVLPVPYLAFSFDDGVLAWETWIGLDTSSERAHIYATACGELLPSAPVADIRPADPSVSHYMPETGHAIAAKFWAYLSSHGLELSDPGVPFRESLALFGFPLSEPTPEANVDSDTVLTQYFERAVFEHHPDNQAPYQVPLRRLGAEALEFRGWQ